MTFEEKRGKMMKKCKKFVRIVLMVIFALGVLSLTGCGRTGDDSEQTDTAVSFEISEAGPTDTGVQTNTDTAQTQDDTQKQGGETGSIMRAYSDSEKQRMAELEQSYQNETAKPGKMISEVDSPEAVTEGTLCYIKSTGEYYLPDRELTDEELLEIIDCNIRIAINSQGWTQEKIDEANWRDRVAREEKVKAAGGISEDEAIEIARKAMEADLGEKAKELEVGISPDNAKIGRKVWLRDEGGVICYCVEFCDKEEVADLEEFCFYHCKVNAVDGSIYEACSLSGDVDADFDDDDYVFYEH